jgi:uncharacterized protein YjbI with pentapeptide repeats
LQEANLSDADVSGTNFAEWKSALQDWVSPAKNLTCAQLRSAKNWQEAKGPIVDKCKAEAAAGQNTKP